MASFSAIKRRFFDRTCFKRIRGVATSVTRSTNPQRNQIHVKISATAAALFLFATPVMGQDVDHGKGLYTTCMSCHGAPPGGILIAAGNPDAIASAIRSVASMTFLQGAYSSADLADIAAYIASASAPPPPPTPQFNYSDLWWNPAESGWGLTIVQHGTGPLFCVMFTYASPDVPMWYVIPGGTWTSTTTFTGTVYRVSGTALNQPFAGSNATRVGQATLDFASQNAATFTMAVGSIGVTRSIERQQY
jgi:mono/diheme cytochrome c family protein